MAETAMIKLKEAQCFNGNTLGMLQTWIILTDTYGKPEDRHVDSFIYNFGKIIENGNFKYALTPGKLYDAYNAVTNKKNTGAMHFYKYIAEFEHKGEEEIRQGIKDYDIPENPDDYFEIEVVEAEIIEKDQTINERVSAETEVDINVIDEVDEKMASRLDPKHDVTLHMIFETNTGRSYDARIKFNAAEHTYTILRGSRLATVPTDSCPDVATSRAINLTKEGKINKDGYFTDDVTFKTISAAGCLISMSFAFEDYTFIDGTPFKLQEVLNDKILYSELIE